MHHPIKTKNVVALAVHCHEGDRHSLKA